MSETVATPLGCISEVMRPWHEVQDELRAELAGRETWSLLRVSPQKQKKYVEFLHEYYPHIQCYFPLYTRIVRRHGQRRPVQVSMPVFPGYVFLMVGKECMHVPVSLPVAARWVKFDGVVEGIAGRVIDRLRVLEKNNELVKEVVHVNPYVPGAKVLAFLPVGNLEVYIIRLVGRDRALVDTPICRATVSLHRLQVV